MNDMDCSNFRSAVTLFCENAGILEGRDEDIRRVLVFRRAEDTAIRCLDIGGLRQICTHDRQPHGRVFQALERGIADICRITHVVVLAEPVRCDADVEYRQVLLQLGVFDAPGQGEIFGYPLLRRGEERS